MPIKVFYEDGGPYAVVENPEDAATLLKEFSKAKREVVDKATRPNILLSDEAAAKRIINDINTNAKNFLVDLAQYREGVRGDKFSAKSGIAVEKFGGILGGISKIVKNYNRKLEDFVISEMRTEGPSRYRFLMPGPLLAKYEEEINKGMLRLPKSGTTGA